MTAIDPHNFDPVTTTLSSVEVKCGTCGLGQRMCELTYKPKETIEQDTPNPYNGPCERFVGKREWGLYPEPWRICKTCQRPKAQHDLPPCTATLHIAGDSYGCEQRHPHLGWGHSNKEAQAIWGSHNEPNLGEVLSWQNYFGIS